jgi:hypothetical protein
MKLAFDHLVFFSQQPKDALLPLQQMGIHAVMGGHHDTWGTYNSLSYFDLSYLEFLGIENIEIANTHEENRLVTGIVQKLAIENQDGPATIAIRTNQIDELALKFKLEGLKVYGPLPGQRVRGDGEVIRWQLLFAEDPSRELALPFFIQWEKPDGERYKDLTNQGLIGKHPAGSLQLDSIGFVVHHLEETVETWGKWLNLVQSEEFIDPTLNARCKKLELTGTDLLFCTPIGDGPAKKVLNEKGETPFLINISGAHQNQLMEMLGGYWRL